jgi:uncharacterized protein
MVQALECSPRRIDADGGMRQIQNSTRAARLAALAVLGAAPLAFFGQTAAARAETGTGVTEPIEIVTSAGRKSLHVEIADTPGEHAVGLMYRTALADDRGMLFLHSEARELTMWMRNTYIPLDMVFVRSDGTVHRIEAKTEPFSEEVIASKGDVTAVLELAGGAAERLGLKPGDRIVHRHFDTAAK